MELLSPAGNEESLIAAVQNGADAVYLGGSLFSARRYAGNFDDTAMQRAIDYCHVRGVKVHVAVNTLLLDRELESALAYAAFLYRTGADALIVQDLGLAALLRQTLPGLTLHASTQMGIHDAGGLVFLEQQGITRAVLARELRIAEVALLHQNSPVELECFAHGALCTAVSGACLFSSLAGGRSGNRGDCAQPCRKTYTVETETGKAGGGALSLSDLCMLHHVQELEAAGVASIKLEGRMKRAEYVALMTRAYRLALDGAASQALDKELALLSQIFQRGSTTGHYYTAGLQVNAVGVLSDEHSPLEAARETYRKEQIKRPIQAEFTLSVGKPMQLTMRLEHTAVTVTGACPEPANKRPDVERYKEQLAKLGDTPFTLASCRIAMDEPAYVPVSALNALRRDAVAALTEALTPRREAAEPVLPPLTDGKQTAHSSILAIVPDAAGAKAAFQAGAELVALSPARLLQAHEQLLSLQAYRSEKQKLLLLIPAALFDPADEKAVSALFDAGLLDGGIGQNIGHVRLIQGIKIGGYLLNAANRYTVRALLDAGYDGVLLSQELTKPQLRDIINGGNAGILGYGKVALMQLRHCPVKSMLGCLDCGGKPGVLQDEAGRRFPLDAVRLSKGCLVRVRNCHTLDVLDVLHELPTPMFTACLFTWETPEQIAACIQTARLAESGKAALRLGDTRGHWARGLE